ncbi:hypothetical protein [Streptomyces sp. DSM 40907]|uniref:hypothetical protein n=1 Tax=Streptomyces kutzneri TaxID=3051179 RepID=UPI0028D6A8B0|nr:hypothetical protein [Streptomyces sp. DSM 40907]
MTVVGVGGREADEEGLRQREDLLEQCRVEQIVAARNRWERAFCVRTIERLVVCVGRLLALVAEGNEDGTALLASLKRDPGTVVLAKVCLIPMP